MTNLVPLHDNVLIEPIVEENVSAGGFILPDENKEKPSKGTVVAVGQGTILDDGSRGAMDVKIGDIVYFTKYSPDEIEMNDTTYLVVKQSSLLAVQAG